MEKRVNWKAVIISAVIVIIILFVGNLFTSGNVNSDWYDSVKPSITPPNYVFPIVWTILYVLIAIALYFVFINKKNERVRKILVSLFVFNLIVNALWSYLFFTLQEPVFAFFDLLLIWISILGVFYYSWKVDRRIGYLILPYFLWVSFAGILNYMIAF